MRAFYLSPIPQVHHSSKTYSRQCPTPNLAHFIERPVISLLYRLIELYIEPKAGKGIVTKRIVLASSLKYSKYKSQKSVGVCTSTSLSLD